MSDDNQYSENYESKPPGMSSGTKVVLISLAVMGGLCVACCGGLIFYFYKNFDMQMSDDPVVVQQAQRDILDLQIPARFEPRQSMKMKFMVANMEMAMFEAKGDEASQLALMKMSFTMEEMNQQQAEAQFNQQNPAQAPLDEATTEARTYTIDGREIEVTFAHGKLQAGGDAPPDQVGKEWYTVSSMTPVSGGFVMFNVSGPEEEFDEEEVETMIESIRFPKEE